MAAKPRPFVKPNWLDQIEFIGRYVVSGCGSPAGIYAEAATPFAKDIALLFLDLSVADFVKEIFRPKGLRSKRHGRKGRKSGRGPRGIPDPNELAGRAVGAELGLPERSYGIGTRVFFVVTDLADRINWTAALLEAVSDITFGTVLGVLEHQGQDCPNIRRLWRAGGYHVEGGIGPLWQTVGTGPVQYNVGLSTPTDWLVFLPKGRFSVTLGLSTVAPVKSVQVVVRIRDVDNDTNIFAESPIQRIPREGREEFVLHCQLQGPVGFVIEAQHDGGFWDVVHDDLMVLEIF